ncbi:MAG: hypothetical protein V9E98_03350 [Candidatus Nanopelagicales bacterium]
MTLPEDLSQSLTRRVLDGELPEPVYAVIGAVDGLSRNARGALSGVTRTPSALAAAVVDQYDNLVARGQSRSVEFAAERAVRKRVSRFEDRWAPTAARTTARINERRQRWRDTRGAQRAARAKERARRTADRFAEMNAPVLMDEATGGRS